MIKPDGDKAWGTFWVHRDDPVFEVSFEGHETYPNGDRLPHIWITEPILDGEGGYDGRTYTMIYPHPSHLFPSLGDDEDGEDALYYGGSYYDEGMGYSDPADHDKRIDCFRAAEVFYRHSAGRGNAVANLCLGYVYSYDRCEGRYWRDPMTLKTDEDYERPYPREERAFECFSIAADAGIPEACYKLGDMYREGVGCEPDAATAHDWYLRASKLAMMNGETPVVLGSIALRLAGCFEEGFGCEQSFSCALQMYRHAARALDAAVDAGEAWYEKALVDARAGVKRCEQETLSQSVCLR